MSTHHLVALGPEEVIRAIADSGSLEGVQVGRPRPVDGFADAVDAPLGPEEVKLLMEALSFAVQSAQGLVLLFLAMKKLLAEKREPAPIRICDPRTGRMLLLIQSDTDPEEAARRILKDK